MKLWQLLKKLAVSFVMIDGIDHMIISTVAVIGLLHQHISLTHQFSAWFTPLCDYVLGSGSLLASYVFISKGGKKNGKRKRSGRKQLSRGH